MRNNTPPPPKLTPRQTIPLQSASGMGFDSGVQTSSQSTEPISYSAQPGFVLGSNVARSAPIPHNMLPEIPDPVLLPATSHKEPPSLMLPASLSKQSGFDDWANAPHGRSLTNYDSATSFVPDPSSLSNLSSTGRRSSLSHGLNDDEFGLMPGRSPTAFSILSEMKIDKPTTTTHQHSSRSILSTKPHFDPVLDDEDSAEDSEVGSTDDIDDDLQFEFTLK